MVNVTSISVVFTMSKRYLQVGPKMASATTRLWNKVAKPVTRASLGPDKRKSEFREREREREIQ